MISAILIILYLQITFSIAQTLQILNQFVALHNLCSLKDIFSCIWEEDLWGIECLNPYQKFIVQLDNWLHLFHYIINKKFIIGHLI